MKRENLIYLLCGLAFGALVGIAVSKAWIDGPRLDGSGASDEVRGPAGPMAPTQTGAAPASPGPSASPDAGAPMVAEIRALQGRLDKDANDVAALVRLANLFHDASMFDRAIEYYERALKLQPDAPDQLTDLGICYRGTQQYDRAIELFQRANRIDPSHWQSLFNMAIVYGFDLQRFDDAAATLARMDAMSPRPPRVDDLRQAIDRERERAGPAGRS